MKPKARKRDSEEEKEGHIPYFDTENSKGKVKKYGMCPSFSETRVRIRRENINLSAIAGKIADRLKKTHVERGTEFIIAENLIAYCDANLLNVVLENLLGNAWKFTSKNPKALIELGAVECGMRNAECETRNSEFNSALRIPHSEVVYFVRDNGAGFDPDYTEKLFAPFQRLHTMEEFPGTGIGLATVKRIIERHGGKVWIEGAVDKGATVYFTL